MLFENIHIVFQLPFMRLSNLIRLFNLMNNFIPSIIVIYFYAIYRNFFILHRALRITIFMYQFAFIHQVRIMFHVYAIRKQPQLSPTKLIIIKMSSGNKHKIYTLRLADILYMSASISKSKLLFVIKCTH